MRPAQRATLGLPAWLLAACMLQGCAGARPPGHPARPKGPTGWGVYRSHPIAGRGPQACAACHECDQRGPLTAVGELKPHTACFACHREVDFDVAHDAHPLQPLEACHMCHALHGSTREKLLKDATRKLCTDCHDA